MKFAIENYNQERVVKLSLHLDADGNVTLFADNGEFREQIVTLDSDGTIALWSNGKYRKLGFQVGTGNAPLLKHPNRGQPIKGKP